MRWPLTTIVLLCLAAGPATRPTIEQRIESVRVRAESIRIDGRAEDWTGIPAYADPEGDGGKKPALDATRTAIAPREMDLLILLATAGRPISLGSTYAFEIDFAGSPEAEAQIALGKPGTASALVYAGNDKPEPRPVEGVQAAIGNVVEVRLPWDVLVGLLPKEMADEHRQRPRPWVRVSPLTVDVFGRQFADYGASAASYRLLKPPYDLDAPLPENTETPLAMPLPVAGRWLVWQGPFGRHTHQDAWAYDLIMVDNAMRPAKVADSARNADYFSWDKPVTLPLAGRVIRATGDAIDNTPPKQAPKDTPVNEVYVEVARDAAVALSHFRQGTVTAAKDDQLPAGTAVGRVGNSGYSATPHLHLSAWRLPAGKKTIPVVFRGVKVGLNPVADDFWVRELDEWSPREGMVVESK